MSSGEHGESLARLDLLDRLAIIYVVLPLALFLAGWLELWAAVPLLACMAYALAPLAAPLERHTGCWPVLPWHVAVAAGVGCAWTAFGGTVHWVFANADWHVRDAVLHDLVTGRWPVGYGTLGGAASILRAPLGYYLPAALIGKLLGLRAAHAALAAWTALGATLFLLQVLSRTATRNSGSSRPAPVAGTAVGMALLIVAFSGLDVVGTLLRDPASIWHWDITRHLEWWAVRYQYSSMTTQLFWVPNHALCGWLAVGLLCRQPEGGSSVELLLPMLVIAVSLWSPLTALGLVPFVLWRAGTVMVRERSVRLLDPRLWAPALIVGLVVAAYLTLDAGRIPRGWTFGRDGFGAAALAEDVWKQALFFLLEAGLIGGAILLIRRSATVALALGILALLPVVHFGAANDFVMRASIPSLAVLAIGAGIALTAQSESRIRKAVLVLFLAVGAITPVQEFARAAVLERWPIDLDSTLVAAACGQFPPHYVARLHGQAVARLLRPPAVLAAASGASSACINPALRIVARRARESR